MAKRILGDNAIIFAKPGIYNKTFNLVAKNSILISKKEAIKRVLQSHITAEVFIKKKKQKSIQQIASYIGISENTLGNIWHSMQLKVSLNQSLIITLESQARWAIENKLTTAKEIPNYLDFIYIEPLSEINPVKIGLYKFAKQ